MSSYLTVAREASEEIIINKSRFIGYISPCYDEEQALCFLRRIREGNKTATHHCYSYIIGENRGIIRYSDDGEPGGTAGLPITDVLKSKNVVNCCAVVVRYFGGVLLGMGGLVRAYTQSMQAALETAGIVRMELTDRYINELPYSAWDRFRYYAEKLPVRIDEIEYGSSIRFVTHIRSSEKDRVLSNLLDISDRKLIPDFVCEEFEPWPE